MIAAELTKKLEVIRLKIAEAATKAAADPARIRLMAVTKTIPLQDIRLAMETGITLFGENRVQEAADKYRQLPTAPELHLIGHLQRNKAATAVELCHCIQSIDKFSTAAAVNTCAARAGKVMDILIEINTSGEDSKFGLTNEAEYFSLLDQLLELPQLAIKGLMTIGPFPIVPQQSRKAFIRLRQLFEKTVTRYGLPDFRVLSMGMSQDFELAIEEGANLIRLGTALFGER